MLILAVSIIVLGALCALMGFLAKGGEEQPANAEPTCATCTGENAKCEQECMLEAAVKDIEYYDDEQLDRFQGVTPTVTMTMRWRSLPMSCTH